MPLNELIHVAQITGRGDPALDRKHEACADAVRAYAKTRSASDLAKLPLLPGRTLRLFAVRVLTPEARALVRDTNGDASRALLAVRLGVPSYTDAKGSHDAPVETTNHLGHLAKRDWCTTLSALGGGALIDELSSVVLTRADVGDADEGDDPLGLYELPHGSRLAL